MKIKHIWKHHPGDYCGTATLKWLDLSWLLAFMSMFCLSPMNSECIINQFQGPVIFEGWRQPSPYNTAMRTIGLRRLGGLAPGFEGNMTRLLVLLVFDLPLGLRRRRWPRFFWPFFPVAAFEEHNSSNHLKLHVPYIYHIYLLHGPMQNTSTWL